ncbi:(2Fe-2S) ferredoxin domain-containing protein [Metabacillus fastidiosus]|uniref:(2Fe-2S) ferredoxin domain-containing protein n=1 Tax=Metabacillus fastidiosus TaxID=1458 RepID=UPI002E1AA783|nr:(2Fe-2S) ferredoxin domain-containing protein [Metabacillus fastidiosus]
MATWNLEKTNHHVLICNGSSCMKKDAEDVTEAIRSEITNLDLDQVIHTSRTRCNGRCKDAPVVIVYPEGTWYKEFTPELARTMVKEHLIEGKIMNDSVIYTYENGSFCAPESSDSICGVEKKAKVQQ